MKRNPKKLTSPNKGKRYGKINLVIPGEHIETALGIRGWAAAMKIPAYLIYDRLRHGWTPYEAIFTPIKPRTADKAKP